MGKKRKLGHGAQKSKVHNQQAEVDDSTSVVQQPCLIDPTSRGYVYDAVDDYEDRIDGVALNRATKMMARKSRAREQVLAIDTSSSDNEGDNDDDADEDSDEDKMFMEDDIVDEPEELEPDDRAWGKNKRRYIGTDTTDERIHKQVRGEDEVLSRLEEEAARKLQERLAAELDYLPTDDLIPLEEEEAKESKVESALEVNLSGLSRSKKLQLLRTESPEFMPLLEDLKEKCEELRTFLGPLMEGVRGGQVMSSTACQYITTKYRLVLNYVCVVSAYMLIRVSQTSVKNHPVLGRLAQYRQLLQELSLCDTQLEPHLKNLVPIIKASKASKKSSASAKEIRKPKKVQILKKKDKHSAASDHSAKLSELLPDLDSSDEERAEKSDQKKQDDILLDKEAEVSSEGEQEPVENEAEDTLDPDGKRAITYQISKNKGLLPSRKKEQRNPRVKYRRKYSTKLKKRKGQVREVRRELKRYEGEASGIKSHTIKSIKIM